MGMEEKVVLFGTGEDLKKCLGVLREQGIEPYCFTDNNPAKWGTVLEGKEIIAPSELARIDCRIMITTSGNKAQIMSQLKEMGLEDRMLEYLPIFRNYIDMKADSYHADDLVIHDKECILVDAFMGNGWDGDQQYACCIAACLKERGYDTHVYAMDSLVPQSDKTEDLISRFPCEPEKYWDALLPIIKDMEQRLPFLLIANSLEYVMAAAYIIKQKYPDQIRIISVLHNDIYALYEKHMQWQDSLDYILGISKRVVNCLDTVWNIPAEKVLYRIDPVFWGDDIAKASSDIKCKRDDDCGQLRIGWAGRLVVTQKRIDLLPALIEALEQRNIDYRLEIAGDGSGYQTLEAYIKQNKLEDKVQLLGYMEHNAIKAFWRRQHVYVHLSDYEGCCLSMLEAMECGAVPVVTDVGAAQEVVHNGETGFKTRIRDIETIADKIAYLANNPDQMKQMSQEAEKVVREMCDLNQYIDYIEKVIQYDILSEED